MLEPSILVNIPDQKGNNYPIYINNDSFKNLKNKLDEETKDKKRLVIFSEKVYKLYGKILGFNRDELFILKDGEPQKNIKNYEKIIKKAISLKLSRKDIIIAIGGGVVGDISGFVAATYMRGIDFIQVPTTLLSCVDSSVGGKTAIDMPNGKNFVGAFHQPKSVFINLNFLKTLDETQYKSGFGEIIKYAFIEKTCNNSKTFNLIKILKENIKNYRERDPIFLGELIKICLELKSTVVNLDEKEQGLRKILNLGHTLGHALEEITGYKKISHGYGVILGIMFVFNYSLTNSLCTKKYYDEAFTLIQAYGYDYPKYLLINKNKLLNLMLSDKKSDGKSVTLIIPTNEGTVTEQIINNINELNIDFKYKEQ